MIKKIIFITFCSLTGIVFLISGFTKLYPIEPFEYTFVDLGIFNWQAAPFAARLFTGLEFFIGLFLFFNLNLRKFAYKLSIFILLLFCIYLVLQIFYSGNKGNCGCFGSYFQMTPLQAIIKNIIMLGIFFVLYKFYAGFQLNKYSNLVIIIFFITAFSLPFILNPVELDYSRSYLNKLEDKTILPLDSLYKNATLNTPPKSLSHNKQIIAFLSLTCKHCKIAANKIRIIHERNPDIPFYLVFNGEEKDLKPFFDNTNTEDIPHCILNGRNFIYLAGIRLPVIYLVNNSIVEYNVFYFDLDQQEIENWLKK